MWYIYGNVLLNLYFVFFLQNAKQKHGDRPTPCNFMFNDGNLKNMLPTLTLHLSWSITVLLGTPRSPVLGTPRSPVLLSSKCRKLHLLLQTHSSEAKPRIDYSVLDL